MKKTVRQGLYVVIPPEKPTRTATYYVEKINDLLLNLVTPVECLSAFEDVTPEELVAIKKSTNDFLSMAAILRTIHGYHERKQRKEASAIVVTSSSQEIARERRARSGGR